ncbi:MAG TPA: hypothetical protein VGE97_09445 [Nitrososphaera sp.]
MYYIHKHEVTQAYGGPEEGDWWYNAGTPDEHWEVLSYHAESTANAKCRQLNEQEHERRKKEERYDYTSVLSYHSTFYAYSVHDTEVMEHYPKARPHYE